MIAVDDKAAWTVRLIQRALLAIALLNISFQIQKHFFLRTDVSELGSLGGLQLSLTNLALALLYLLWIVKSGMRSSMPALTPAGRRPWSGLILLAALVVAMYVLSLFAAGDRELATFEIVYLIEQLLLLIYIATTTVSRSDVLFIIRVLLVGLALQSVLMLAQAVGVVGDLDAIGIKARAEFAGDPRISGTLGSPNPAAAYLALSMVLALALLLASARRKDRWLAGAGLAMAVLPLVFTRSRGGWLQLIFGVGILVVAARHRLLLKRIAGVAALLVLLLLPFGGAVASRLNGDDNGSAASRAPMNRLALAIIEDHPVRGVGSNNYAIAMLPYITTAEFKGTFFYTVHNKYLLVFAETGAGGLLAFIAFLGAILREGWKGWKLGDPVVSPIALGCVAGVAGLILQMNVEPARTDPYSHLIWLIGGLVVAIRRIAASPTPGPTAADRLHLARGMG